MSPELTKVITISLGTLIIWTTLIFSEEVLFAAATMSKPKASPELKMKITNIIVIKNNSDLSSKQSPKIII
jgi:uncharacterized membrane protein